MQSMFHGDDTWAGGKGDDKLWDGAQDFIGLHVHKYEIRDKGDDTIIDLGNGDQLVLKDVHSSELTDANFYFY
jgi:hypothetical protein